MTQDWRNAPLDLGLTPADFGLLRFDPEEFSLWELDRYILDLRSKGLDPGGYVVDRDLKYAMPLACVIMVGRGLALSLDPLPRSLSLHCSFGLSDSHRRLRLLDSRWESRQRWAVPVSCQQSSPHGFQILCSQ